MTKSEAETLLQLIISDDNTAVQLGYDLFIQHLDYFRHNQDKTIPPEIEEELCWSDLLFSIKNTTKIPYIIKHIEETPIMDGMLYEYQKAGVYQILKLLGYRLEYKPTITNPCVEITL